MTSRAAGKAPGVTHRVTPDASGAHAICAMSVSWAEAESCARR